MNFLCKLPCVAKTPVQKYCLVIDLELFKVLYLRSYKPDLYTTYIPLLSSIRTVANLPTEYEPIPGAFLFVTLFD